MPYADLVIRREYSRKWIANRRKDPIQRLKEKIWKKKYNSKHAKQNYLTTKKWREKHPENVKRWQNRFKLNHIGYFKLYKKKYYKENPEKFFGYNMKHLKKLGNNFNINSKAFRNAYLAWSKSIKKRDKVCQICNSSQNLKAHHLFYKSSNPKLVLNLNNGITLCELHHKEIHFPAAGVEP